MRKFLGQFPIRVKDFKVEFGTCPDCVQKRNARFEALRIAASLNWTSEKITDYFKKNPPQINQEVLLHDTTGHANTYILAKITDPSHTKQKRIVIDGYSNGWSGSSFYRSGKNCYAPKGQVYLLPYNQIVGDLIEKGNGKSIDINPEDLLSLLKN
jgi:hypothetical protein